MLSHITTPIPFTRKELTVQPETRLADEPKMWAMRHPEGDCWKARIGWLVIYFEGRPPSAAHVAQ